MIAAKAVEKAVHSITRQKMRGPADGGGDHPVVDHHHPQIHPGDALLDEHVGAVPQRQVEGLVQAGLVADADGDAPALLAAGRSALALLGVLTWLRDRDRQIFEESPRRAGMAQLVADQTHVYHPGQIVPISGIYRCVGGDGDHVLESTDVKGHRFPPLPAGCTGSGWVLERAAGHR